MNPDAGEAGAVRIGELSRRVGVSPSLLRAWEKRYGLLLPSRSDGNFRLYSAADERRVRVMQAEMTRGLSAAEAARAALAMGDDVSAQTSEAVAMSGEHADALRSAALALDEPEVQRILDRAFALHPLEAVLADVVLPCFREIGDGWERAEVSVAQEHFATNVIRSRLVTLTRGWDQAPGERVVLACVPREQHDIGLLCFGLALWSRGWRILYLGQATPVAEMRTAFDEGPARAVVAYAHSAELLRAAEAELTSLAADCDLVVAGGGVGAIDATRIGAELLADDPIRAAVALDARWSGTSR